MFKKISQKHLDYLARHAAEEGSECGEYWLDLSNIYNNAVDMASPEFLASLESEILCQVHYIQSEFEWVEEEVTIPAHTKKQRVFRYKGSN